MDFCKQNVAKSVSQPLVSDQTQFMDSESGDLEFLAESWGFIEANLKAAFLDCRLTPSFIRIHL